MQGSDVGNYSYSHVLEEQRSVVWYIRSSFRRVFMAPSSGQNLVLTWNLYKLSYSGPATMAISRLPVFYLPSNTTFILFHLFNTYRVDQNYVYSN